MSRDPNDVVQEIRDNPWEALNTIANLRLEIERLRAEVATLKASSESVDLRDEFSRALNEFAGFDPRKRFSDG